DLDQAIEYHQKALKIDQELGSKEGMANAYTNLGNVYKTRGDLDQAIEYYQK
ncbi:MAG: tetratricopeptide repeat protein, partial [Proteobacteria bacterium]|nr:tetratricopeptide repeat protein [Pseudomonadota bacterium]